MLKAINNFDPAFGGSPAAYAQPCIAGEIERHLRDKRFLVHVKRSVQELILEGRKATTQLTQDLGRVPTESDLARRLGVSGADLREAQRAELALQASSLDAPVAARPGAASLADFLGQEDQAMEHMLGIHSVAAHSGQLRRRKQQILTLRFYRDMAQEKIGHQLGISKRTSPGSSPTASATSACACSACRSTQPPHGSATAPPGGARPSAGALT